MTYCRWIYKTSWLLCSVDWWTVTDVSRNVGAFIFRVKQTWSGISETSVTIYHSTWRKMAECLDFHSHRCDKLKFCKTLMLRTTAVQLGVCTCVHYRDLKFIRAMIKLQLFQCFTFLHYDVIHHHHWHNSPFWAKAFFRSFCQLSLFLAAFLQFLSLNFLASSVILFKLFQ